MRAKKISLDEFDRLFDEGSDEIDEYLDWDRAVRGEPERQFVSLALSDTTVAGLDKAARILGIQRDELADRWLAEHLFT